MNKIVTLNALRGNSYSLFRKIPLMVNMGVCAFCLVPAMAFAENTHEITVLNAQQQTRKAVGVVTDKTGEPIIGANVIVKGTTNGTITDLITVSSWMFLTTLPCKFPISVLIRKRSSLPDNLQSRFNWWMIRKPWMRSW